MESRGLPLREVKPEIRGKIEEVVRNYVFSEEEGAEVSERIARLSQYYEPENQRMFQLLNLAATKGRLGTYMNNLDNLFTTKLAYMAPEQSRYRETTVRMSFDEWESQLKQ